MPAPLASAFSSCQHLVIWLGQPEEVQPMRTATWQCDVWDNAVSQGINGALAHLKLFHAKLSIQVPRLNVILHQVNTRSNHEVSVDNTHRQ